MSVVRSPFAVRGWSAGIYGLRTTDYGLFLLLGLLIAGCAAPSGTGSRPKPGRGIGEYRQLAKEAHRAVTATVDSLEALSRPHPGDPKPHPALARFDRALHRLELTSIKTRARAEAIIARGQAYFDEWKQQLSGVTEPSAAQSDTERYSRLFEHFDRIRERSGDVRSEFRPFMAHLREFRARLDTSPDPTGSESSRSGLEALMASGRRVLGTLESVSKALDAAEMELRATLVTKR